MFDVGDLPVLTFGNCVLKNGVIKWPLKLYVGRTVFTFLTFFQIQKNITFTFFWVAAHVFSNTRFVESGRAVRIIDGGI